MTNPNYSVINFHNFSVSLFLNNVTISYIIVSGNITRHITLGIMPTIFKNLFILQI